MKRFEVKAFVNTGKTGLRGGFSSSFAYLSVLFLMLCSAGCDKTAYDKQGVFVEREFIVTGYCECRKCCGWHRNWLFQPVSNATGKRKIVGQTASGVQVHHGTIAAPPEYPFGTVMYIEGYGLGRVEDRGGDIKGNRLDLYFKSHKTALEWGKQKKIVKVWLPQQK